MGCKGFSTCYGYNCGGGAVEQTMVGYDGAGGTHPKCQLPPETMQFEIGGWEGTISMVPSLSEIDRQNLGCQHSNCTCVDPKCNCWGTDLGGNTNFMGHMTAENCHSRGLCLSPDMTVQGCCEDPVTGAKPTSNNAGFGWDLNPEECACRGGVWSTECRPWGQDQLDSCDQCKAVCPPHKMGSLATGYTYSEECEQGNVAVDADGVRCCCDGDSPKCDSCPNHCVVWQGTTVNTCGPPVLFGPDSDPGKGYGITYPWEVTLVCLAPAQTAHGWKADPPDYGSWQLTLTAWRPNGSNKLWSDDCKTWTFTNSHGQGDLNIASVCEGGAFTMIADVPLTSDEVSTACKCSCPCFEQVSNVHDGEECDCADPECLSGGPHEDCVDGTSDPPECDTTCLVPKPACPAMDAIWKNARTDDPPANGDGTHIQDWCTDGSSGESDVPGDPNTKAELLGVWKYKEDECGICCKACDANCADGCVCEKEEALLGPSSICGMRTYSYRNTGGHGCSKPPKLTFEGDSNKEGMCCNPGYFEPCIEESYYECGCLSEDAVNSGSVTITIQAATSSPPITTIRGVGSDGRTPVGGDDPGEILNVCEPVDAICDQSKKYPDTQGCRYTKWPDPDCAAPLPVPDHTQGVRCPNSLVYEQPVYGLQCVLPGGSNNGPGNWDFDVKPVGACLNARSERWHLRPQFTHPHLWAICHPAGHGEPAPPCDQPADRDLACIEHPEASRFVADLGNIHGNITECNIYCEGWWEVIVDCTRAWVLGLCEACLGDCWEDRELMGADPWPVTGSCPQSDMSGSGGCDGKWPGEFPFLYYHPPIPEFCPYGEYFPAIGCPSVPNSPADTIHGGTAQLFYPGNINHRWSSCCGNQPAGCECCYSCGHPAYDPTCRVRNLVSGNICDVCWECMCNSTFAMDGYIANQIYGSEGCPNGCTHDGDFMSGQCVQVVQDGGNEVAGCGQFLDEIPDICDAPVYCPEGLIPYDKYGGGFCIEGDMCCQCLRKKGGWLKNNSLVGPTNNPLGWKLGAPILYDMAWYPLKEAVCLLEPCGMGEGSEGVAGLSSSNVPILYDKGAIKVSMTLMREGTSTEVGKALRIEDHQSRGDIIGITGPNKPITITTRLQVGQLEVNLSPGDPIFIGEFNDSQGNKIGSQVEGVPAANGQFEVISVSGNSFSIAHPGGGPVIGDGSYDGGGTWFYYDPNDSGASCTAPNTSCAFDFEFLQGGTNVGTTPKVLPETLFIECVEEAFIEWGHIIESLWSPHADYSAVDRRHGSWSGSSDPFPGSYNNNPGLPDHASSHQLRFRFVNLGHENPEASVVPSNKKDRYEVPQWRGITNYPEIGNCVHKGNNPSAPDTPQPIWKNMGECITHGYCLDKGCSANDMRQEVIKGHNCPLGSNPDFGTEYLTPKSCFDARYYACLTRPKHSTPEFGDGAVRTIGGEAFGYPKKTLNAQGDEIYIPTYPRNREWLDPQYIIAGIASQSCCAEAYNRETGENGGFWEEISGDWSADYGNGSGIWNPGTKGRTPCVPKTPECCQGTAPCAPGIQDHFLIPTNEHTPASCCKEYEKSYGQCLGDYDLDGNEDELLNSGYDECAYGEAGWCVDSNGVELWNSEDGDGHDREACEDIGASWRPAFWNPIYDWQAHTWNAQVDYDMPFYGKTGDQCSDWPEQDQCCPRIGQVRIGMVNWYDALRERWAAEGKGQCYDCNTGVVVGGQTIFGPNSVELHGECRAYQEDTYDKTLIGLTPDSQADCLALNGHDPRTGGEGKCSNSNYVTKQDCISNGELWYTWEWGAYINKDICNNAGHCWDYRDPPLVPASGNPFACGYMGGMRCMKQVEGVWIPCIPESKPYARANNAILDKGYGCTGFRPGPDSHVIPAQPGGGDPPDAPTTGGEPCICITEGKEGIAGDLYIDSSVKWRPDWVSESDKPGAWSIKRVLMKQIGHMLGLPEGSDIMAPLSGPSENAVQVGADTYHKLIEMYEPRWWNRGGTNDYWWVSGIYAGDFK